MSKFKRVSLAGSEELFRPTRPKVVEDTDEVITEAVERRPPEREEVSYLRLALTEDEVKLLLEAIQAAKYPNQSRPQPSLDRFERYDALREKLQGS
jgi:hypothetical protein